MILSSREKEALTRSIGAFVAKRVDAALAPVLQRLTALEERPGFAGAIKDSRGVLFLTLTDGRNVDTGIRDGVDGKDADPLPDIEAMVGDAVLKAVEPIDGALKEAVEAIKAIPAPVAVPEIPELPDIDAMVAEAVAAAVKALPAPADGKDADPALIERLVADEVDAAFASLPAAKDGVGLAGAVIDRNGHLIVTMTDGTNRDLGPVVGKDGEPGRPGEPGHDGVDGKSGKDGADGVGFDDLTFDGERTVSFIRGEKRVDIVFPALIDRGVYKAGETYQRGDMVTWAGSLWIAQKDTNEKPEASDGWRLSVKRGRDGKDGKDGSPGAPGRDGKPGRDGSF